MPDGNRGGKERTGKGRMEIGGKEKVVTVWLGGLVVRALDLQSTGRGFDSRPRHRRVATLDKLFT